MKLENQVCTLEQSKLLKELAIAQESLYWWDEDDNEIYRCVDGTAGSIGCYAAFNVAELGLMLPRNFKIHKLDVSDWQYSIGGSDWKNWKQYETEAQARAALLIHLLEQQLITIDEVNQRLQAA